MEDCPEYGVVEDILGWVSESGCLKVLWLTV